jgi:gas vesicle protein
VSASRRNGKAGPDHAAELPPEVQEQLAESRRRVQQRVEQIGEAVDREVETARSVRDGFIAVLGVAAVLLGARRATKALRRKRKGKKNRKRTAQT